MHVWSVLNNAKRQLWIVTFADLLTLWLCCRLILLTCTYLEKPVGMLNEYRLTG